MVSKKVKFFLSLIVVTQCLFAQTGRSFTFGKITPADFNVEPPAYDSGASAIFIADVGSVTFDPNLDILFRRKMRIKILSKNGFEIANRKISLYHNRSGDKERLLSIKGTTFNLENGIVTEIQLDEKSIFDIKYSKYRDDKKFSMPALKVGTIIDLEYVIKSPFDYRLMPWSFQGAYPRAWSEFSVTLPEAYHYVARMQGDSHFYIDSAWEYFKNGTFKSRKWVKTNIPSIHEEPFTTTIDNYESNVTFQLSYVQWGPNSQKHFKNSNWTMLSQNLMEDESFGALLSENNGWMEDDLNALTKGIETNKEKAIKIYSFIRDNIKCTDHEALYAYQPIKTVLKKRMGNEAEINLLLAAMLRKAGIEADPMILSTRENGIADPSYPLTNEYNYVACVAYIDRSAVTLDASQPYNTYGDLPLNCYNGYGHVINPNRAIPVELFADSLVEVNIIRVVITNEDNGILKGSYTNYMGKRESYSTRKEIDNSTIDNYKKKIGKKNETDLTITDFSIDSLKKVDYPLILHFGFSMKNMTSSETLYFNPIINTGYKTNPFTSGERLYPVEMPYQIDENYILKMDIPKGYRVEELPRSVRINYNENEGFFEYLFQADAELIQMRVKLKLKKAFFPTDEYSTLRDFFADVVKKESAQIVFKKIK